MTSSIPLLGPTFLLRVHASLEVNLEAHEWPGVIVFGERNGKWLVVLELNELILNVFSRVQLSCVTLNPIITHIHNLHMRDWAVLQTFHAHLVLYGLLTRAKGVSLRTLTQRES